jgi:hypothetical protein
MVDVAIVLRRPSPQDSSDTSLLLTGPRPAASMSGYHVASVAGSAIPSALFSNPTGPPVSRRQLRRS